MYALSWGTPECLFVSFMCMCVSVCSLSSVAVCFVCSCLCVYVCVCSRLCDVSVYIAYVFLFRVSVHTLVRSRLFVPVEMYMYV